MPRPALVWHDRVPVVRRDPPGLPDLLRVRLFPPSYRTVPWPIPDDWGREWQRRVYLRSLGVRPARIGPPRSPFRDAAIAALACAAVVALLTAATRLWAWGHL